MRLREKFATGSVPESTHPKHTHLSVSSADHSACGTGGVRNTRAVSRLTRLAHLRLCRPLRRPMPRAMRSRTDVVSCRSPISTTGMLLKIHRDETTETAMDVDDAYPNASLSIVRLHFPSRRAWPLAEVPPAPGSLASGK